MSTHDAGVCPLCADEHGPNEPHNAGTLHYQTRFRLRYGRPGRWSDALAHCSVLVQLRVSEELRLKGVWTDTDNLALRNGDAIAEPVLPNPFTSHEECNHAAAL